MLLLLESQLSQLAEVVEGLTSDDAPGTLVAQTVRRLMEHPELEKLLQDSPRLAEAVRDTQASGILVDRSLIVLSRLKFGLLESGCAVRRMSLLCELRIAK